jgi:hypothetical protein
MESCLRKSCLEIVLVGNVIVHVTFSLSWASVAVTRRSGGLTLHFCTVRVMGLRKNAFFTFADGQGILFSKPPALNAAAFRHYSLPDTYGIQETDWVGHVVFIQDASLAAQAWRYHTNSPVHRVLQRAGPACNEDWCGDLTSHICTATQIGRRTALLQNWYGQKHSPTPSQARDRGASG